jgi:hypothetical protein
MSQTTVDGGTNTFVSNPSGGGPYVAFSAGAAPGAQGIGGSLQISHAILVIIASSATALVVLGYLFRK